jgi:hypothetical protein
MFILFQEEGVVQKHALLAYEIAQIPGSQLA